MSQQAQTHAVMAALSTMAQLGARGQSLRHEQEMAALRNGALAHMVDALVSRRAEAVKEGFTALLNQYGEQARHFMAQQKTYADKELDTDDPLRCIQLRGRIQQLDVELATIRADAKLLYDRMAEVILALGGSTLGFASELGQPLALGTMRG